MKALAFSGNLPLKVLDESKTETRRLVKTQPPNEKDFPGSSFGLSRSVADGIKMYHLDNYERLPKHPTDYDLVGSVGVARAAGFPVRYRCQFKVGEIRYIKEAYYVGYMPCDPDYEPPEPPHKSIGEAFTLQDFWYKTSYTAKDKPQWKSPRFMPEWASRAKVEITAVRLEWLNEITEEACIAEGIESWSKDGNLNKYWPCDPFEGFMKCTWQDLPRTRIEAFTKLWDHLHAKDGYSFASNPVVEVVTFKLVTA